VKLYHYSTWQGRRIYEEGFIAASVAYERFTGSTLLNSTPLIFLTSNPSWEPSVQARSKRLHWEKCGSCPEVYTELGIPCWKFQVKDGIGVRAVDYSTSASWRRMLGDAIILGSDPEQWYICGGFIHVIEPWQWENGQWTTLRN
jgi:hypothetical protein